MGAINTERWATRFVAPIRPSNVPVRPAIASRLSDAVGQVVVIAAPAGYGKSSQAAAWASEQARPVAWADLARVDNDPTVLLAVLLRMLVDVTDLDATVFPTSHWAPEELSAVVVPAFGDLVAGLETPFVLVLDDVHVIDSPAAIDLLDALAANIPVGATLVLVGRATPGTSLGRLRLRPGVVEITMEDLALSVPEADAIFRSMGLVLSEDRATRLVAHTEGWPVGVRLAGLALLGQHDAEAAAAEFTGQDRYVVDYLREEWMSGLSPDDATFLMQVACLDWFSGELCDQLLRRTLSSRDLERLHANTLLVIPLDRRNEWYRLHQLLADCLQEQFRREHVDEFDELHRRASTWFEEHGDIDRAFQHAKSVEDFDRCEQLVVQHMPGYLTRGRQTTVERWLSSFPHGYTAARPGMCIVAAATAMGMGDPAAVERWLRFVDRAHANPDPQLPADEATPLIASALRAMISSEPVAALVDGVELAYTALEPGPWHAVACIAFGGLLMMRGDEAWAAKVLTEGAAEAKVVATPTLEAICRAHLAFIHDAAGDAEHATALGRSARDIVRSNGAEHVRPTMLVPAMHALVAARQGDIEAARADWHLARRNVAYFEAASPWVSVFARLALARTSLLLGDRNRARALYAEAEAQVRADPDAVGPRRHLAELGELLDTGGQLLPYGPTLLTTAELRVLHYLPTNLSLADIATRLFVSRNTAKSHAAAIYRKLGTTSRSEAVELAQRAGLLPSVESVGLDAWVAASDRDTVMGR